MSNPAVDKAKQILDRVSADPASRELTRLREMAAINWRMEMAATRQEGKAEGEAQGKAEALRAAIAGGCLLLGLAIDGPRQAQLAALDVAGLEQLYAALLRERAWPG